MESKGMAVDAELLVACRRGQAEAFEELVVRTERQVYTLAHRLVGDPTEAEDVAQEAYLRVYRSLSGFREDARFETWLYRIVTNVAMTHLRRRGRFGVVLADEEGDRIEQIADTTLADDAVGRDEVQRALAELPGGLRTPVVLKDMYGLTCKEIADEMGLTEGAVKVRLHRARKRLKESIYGATKHAV